MGSPLLLQGVPKDEENDDDKANAIQIFFVLSHQLRNKTEAGGILLIPEWE